MGTTRFWTPVVERLAAIVRGAYGSEHPVPVSTFQVDDTAPDLSQPGEPISQRVRSVRVIPQGSRWTEGQANTCSGENSKTLRVELRIGYRGDTDPPLSDTTASEQARPELQAMDDWDGVVLDAIRRTGNWTGLTPELYNVEQVGEALLERSPEGLVDLVATLELSVSFAPSTLWALGA